MKRYIFDKELNMATANQTAPLEGLTFDKVWAALMELRESQKETDRIVKEAVKAVEETDKQIKETSRQMKETDKRLGELGNRFGEMTEYMVLPNLVERFKDLGLTFSDVSRNRKITNEEHRISMEIDAFMENDHTVMIVETKTTPSKDDINDHLERMRKLRVYADSRRDRRGYRGAVAGVVFKNDVKTYALQNGFYVLEPSGETFAITEPPAPQEW
jgi:hypothetical protein